MAARIGVAAAWMLWQGLYQTCDWRIAAGNACVLPDARQRQLLASSFPVDCIPAHNEAHQKQTSCSSANLPLRGNCRLGGREWPRGIRPTHLYLRRMQDAREALSDAVRHGRDVFPRWRLHQMHGLVLGTAAAGQQVPDSLFGQRRAVSSSAQSTRGHPLL